MTCGTCLVRIERRINGMRAIKRINNNVAVCIDSSGRTVIAIGKGIGFGGMPKQVPLADIDRTFYEVDERYLAGIDDIPQSVLNFAVQAADKARVELPYALSPNLAFTLADHIAVLPC